MFLDLTASAYAMLVLLTSQQNKNPEESLIKQIPDGITEIFKTFIRRHKINNVIKLAKLCQILWTKVASGKCTVQFDPEMEIHFLILQVKSSPNKLH